MFGSLGWALAMFSVGILLDHSKAFTNHPCGKAGPDERNYSVCFAIYSCLMGCALIIATQFKFDYGDGEQIPLKAMAKSIKKQVNKVRGEQYTQFNAKKFVNEEDEEENNNTENFENNNSSYSNTDEMNLDGGMSTATTDLPFMSFGVRKEKYLRLFQLCKVNIYIYLYGPALFARTGLADVEIAPVLFPRKNCFLP